MTIHKNYRAIPVDSTILAGLQSNTGYFSLRLTFYLIAFLILIVAAIAAAFWYLSVNQANHQHIQKQVELHAQAYLHTFNQYMAGLKQSMQVAANNQVVIQAISHNKQNRLNQYAKDLAASLPGVYRVRFLSTGLSEPDENAVPAITESCLLLKQTAASTKTLQYDIHGSPKPHLDLLQPILNKHKRIISYLLVAIDIQTIKDVFKANNLAGYAEFKIQALNKLHTQLAYGNKQLLQSQYKTTLPLALKHWHLAYWADPKAMTDGNTKYKFGWVLSLILSVLLMLILLVLARIVIKRQADDQHTLVQIAKDTFDNRLAEQYPARLRDSQAAINEMLIMAVAIVGSDQNNRPALASVDFNQEPVLAPTKNSIAQAALKVANDSAHNLAPESGFTAQKNDLLSSQVGGRQKQADSIDLVKNQGKSSLQNEQVLDNLNLTLDGLNIEEAPLSEVTVPASVFRAYDMRGIVNDSLTPELVHEIGLAIGSEAIEKGENKVVIARDGRLSGPALRTALSEGLCAAGCEVIDIGQVPTPVLYFAAHRLSNGTGVMITGSHNPPEYNGLKLMIAGQTYFGDLIQGLKSRIEDGNFTSASGKEQKLELSDEYLERIVADVQLARPLKVIVDCGNGVAGELAPRLLQQLGCDVTALFCEIDGNFPNHHPDPSKPENIVDLRRAVVQQQADMGIAFDGDGDRIGIIDSAGQVIWPDRVLMILAEDILQRNPGAKIIYDVKCTRNLAKIIKAHGGVPLMWKTGHSFIKAKIKETGALLAGEMSGHIFINERWFGFDDALYAAARLLEVLSKNSKATAEIFSALPDTVNTPELNIHMQEGEPQPFMLDLKNKADFSEGKLIDIDGIRVEYDDGWGLVRSSNTTPTLVLRFEADNQAALERIQAQFKAQMLAVNPNLDVPF